jgi:DNA-binding NarL/FixJ family response regulator
MEGVFLVPDAQDFIELKERNKTHKPDLLILNFQSILQDLRQIKELIKENKKLKVLAISDFPGREKTNQLFENGISSFLLRECDANEISEAIEATMHNKRFMCGRIADLMLFENQIKDKQISIRSFSCEGLTISERELEIIQNIAEGLSNKEIADKLCLSTHTVNTHRKNIMSKLGVNNTAGVVMYAVKNNLLDIG